MKAKRLLTGLVRTRSEAEAFVIRVLRAGCGCDDISLVLRADGKRSREDDAEPVSDGHGAITALSAGMRAVVRRGLKLVPVGPIAAALLATSGGVSHALVDAGVPEHRARVFEAGIRDGWTLVGVSARSDAEAAMFEEIFQAFGAAQVGDPEEVDRPSALFG